MPKIIFRELDRQFEDIESEEEDMDSATVDAFFNIFGLDWVPNKADCSFFFAAAEALGFSTEVEDTGRGWDVVFYQEGEAVDEGKAGAIKERLWQMSCDLASSHWQTCFIMGWIKAGGVTADLRDSEPICAPWLSRLSLEVSGNTPEEWGASWCKQCKNEMANFASQKLDSPIEKAFVTNRHYSYFTGGKLPTDWQCKLINMVVEAMGYDLHFLKTENGDFLPYFTYKSKVLNRYEDIPLRNEISFALENLKPRKDGSFTLNLKDWTDRRQERFISGWQKAGGDVGDAREPLYPWCTPWISHDTIVVRGVIPEEWGAFWWKKCKRKVEKFFREEVGL